MPNINSGLTTLAEILQHQGGANADLERRIIEGVLYSAPLFSKLPARTIKGTQYKQRVRTSLPLIGPTPYNTAPGSLNLNFEVRNAEAYPYQAFFAVDKKLEHGHREMFGDYAAQVMRAGTRGIMASLEFAAIYGKAFAEWGMHGLVDTIGDYMTISATGKHDSRVYGGASVWALCLTPDDGPTVIWGNNKSINFGQRRESDVTMPKANGELGSMPVYRWDVDFHIGMSQMADDTSARIVNESPANPLTDDMLATLLEQFPAGRTPNVLVMNRKTLSRLRKTRSSAVTHILKRGTTLADTPTEFDGIPILVTDMLLDDETEENVAALAKRTELTMQKNMSNLIR